jgi:hypothetical protein
MAQYDITYQCGHIIHEQLYGKTSERQRHMADAQYRLCPECYRAQQLAKATEANEAAGLPALTGSEKQITWAEQIRAKLMAELAEMEAMAVKSNGTEAQKQQLADAAATLRAKASAAYWIDSREQSARALIVAIIRGH